MAISTDAAIEFFGTQDTITGSGGTVADAAYGTAATTWTNDDDARYAAIVLSCSFGTAPDAGSAVDLFLELQGIQSTNNMDTADSNYENLYAGSFLVDASSTGQQYIPIEITLPNTKTSQQYKFTIKNNCGQTIDTDWNLYITPKAVGPHA